MYETTSAPEIEAFVPQSKLINRLGLTNQSFHRWRKAAKLPRKGFYASHEIALFEAIGEYLAEDRNLSRAEEYVNQLLGV